MFSWYALYFLEGYMKTCTMCLEQKTIDDFYKRKGGWHAQCKACLKQKNHTYRTQNAEKVRQKSRRYYEENKEDIRENFKKWSSENPDYYRNYRLKGLKDGIPYPQAGRADCRSEVVSI